MKKTKARANTEGSAAEPPAAVQPMAGGRAPMREPGTTAKALMRLRGV